jgi:predicted metal-dependent hydrolase
MNVRIIMPTIATFVRAAVAATALMLAAMPAMAGAKADFENALDAAYADYRQALYLTNQKNADATMKAITAFEAKWAALNATYAKAPPPQYVDDPKFADVMAAVAEINQRAKRLAAESKLAESHDVLEAIRDEIGNLRLRNGLMTFSDRINAYHAQMETMVTKAYDGFSAAGLADLREDVAVLSYMADDLKRHPSPQAAAADYGTLLQNLLDSVAAVQKAARSGDGAGAKASLPKLKPTFSRLFAKFG